MRLATLKKHTDFQRVRGGGRFSTSSFVLEGKLRPGGGRATARSEAAKAAIIPNGPRFGFTVTKKLGGAVVRNRIRRRLRAAITELADAYAEPGFDYVVIARSAAVDREFAELKSELETAFKQVHKGAMRQSTRTRVERPDV